MKLRLLAYEFLKLLSNKVYLTSIGLVVVITLIMFNYSGLSSPEYQMKNEFIDLINTKNMSLVDTISSYTDSMNAKMKCVNQGIEIINMSEQTEIDTTDYCAIANAQPYKLESYKYAIDYLGNINEYPSYISKILSTKNPYLVSAYMGLNNVELTPNNILSINFFTQQNLVGLSLLIMGIITTIYLYGVENESHMDSLLLFSNNGKKHAFANKLIVVGCMSIILSLIMFVLLIFSSQLLFGFTNLFQHIQNVPYLYESNLNLNILQYLTFSLLIQIILSLAISSIFILTFSKFNEKLPALLILFVCLGIGFLFDVTISDFSTFSILKYFNLFTWLNVHSILKSFNMYQLFGVRLDVWLLSCIVAVILISIISYISISTSNTYKESKKRTLQLRFENDRHTSMFLHELYKIFIIEKGAIVIAIFLACLAYTVFKNISVPIVDNRPTLVYYDQFFGPLGEHHDEIENIVMRQSLVKSEFLKVQNDFMNNKISEQEYLPLQNKYQSSVIDHYAFLTFYNDYSMMMSGDVMYTSGYNALFGLQNSVKSTQNSFLAVITTVLILCGVFIIDQRKDEEDLYRLSPKGNASRIKVKLIISLLSIAFILISIFLTDFLLVNARFSLQHWSSPLSSLLRQGVDLNIPHNFLDTYSLFTYFTLINITRLIGLVLLGVITLTLAQHIKNKVLLLLSVFGLLFIPFILSQLQLSSFQLVSIIHMLNASGFLSVSGSQIALIVASLFSLTSTVYIIRHNTK